MSDDKFDVIVLFQLTMEDCAWINDLDDSDKNKICNDAEQKAVDAYAKHIRNVEASMLQNRSQDPNQTDIYDFV